MHRGKTRTDEEQRVKVRQKNRFLARRGTEVCVVTVFVILQVVVRPRPSELGQVLLVVELQEVGPLPAESQEGWRQAARQGHEPLGAADTQGTRTVTSETLKLTAACYQNVAVFFLRVQIITAATFRGSRSRFWKANKSTSHSFFSFICIILIA